MARLRSEALDHELPLLRRLGLRLHLLVCAWCRRYGRHVRFLRQQMRRSGEPPAGKMPGALSPAARERIKRALGPGNS